MKVVHVITCLNDGGAEAVLYRLCSADNRNTHVVISLQGEGKYGTMLVTKGISVYCLNATRSLFVLHAFFRLLCLLKKIRPDVVQTWLCHASCIGGLAARASGIKNICWGIHNTDLANGKVRQSTIWIIRLNALLSKWVPVHIVSCSNKGVDIHTSLGYAKNKFSVIHNGHDLDEFMPSLKGVAVLREQTGISNGTIVLGMVARFDSQKDHKNLVAALGLVSKLGYNFCCLLVGTGVSADNSELKNWLEQYRLNNRVLLMGQRTDIPLVMNLIDIHILSSSFGEAFPNVLCEAMACGTPCVTTDVGDAVEIVGESGWVVPAQSSEALSDAIIKAIDEFYNEPDRWIKRQQDARERIKDNFGIEKMVKKYSQVWQSL